MKLRFLLQAKDELSEISDPLFSRVLRRLELLKKFPELGAFLPEPHSDMRSTVVENFRIVYRLLANGVIEINYIRDCRRRPPPRP